MSSNRFTNITFQKTPVEGKLTSSALHTTKRLVLSREIAMRYCVENELIVLHEGCGCVSCIVQVQRPGAATQRDKRSLADEGALLSWDSRMHRGPRSARLGMGVRFLG